VLIAHLSFQWQAPPVVLAGAVVALAFFVQAFVRLRRRRSELVPWTRALLFAAGLALLVLPVVSPLDEAADDKLLSGHMLQHVLIGDAAAALVVVALRGPLLFFLLPPALLRPAAALRPVLSVATRPLVALGLWATAIYAWHVPAAYDYAAGHPLVHDLEHLSFVVAGMLVWIQLVDPARHGRLRRPQRIFFALALVALMQPLADALLFSSSPAYARYADQPDRLFGLSPLTDQRLAGVVMMTEQLLTIGICVGLLLRPYVRERRERLGAPVVPHGSR
jgi:cytochrome c oxidase assembly factor CtaG